MKPTEIAIGNYIHHPSVGQCKVLFASPESIEDETFVGFEAIDRRKRVHTALIPINADMGLIKRTEDGWGI